MAPKSRKPPEKTASLFARGGPDSSDDDEGPAKNTGKPSADLRKHFAPKAAAPAAADPTDEVSTDSDDSDDGKFNFDLPAKAGSKAGGKSKPAAAGGGGASSRTVPAAGLPTGWWAEERTASSGRVYKVYYGPNGEYAESVPQARRRCRIPAPLARRAPIVLRNPRRGG